MVGVVGDGGLPGCEDAGLWTDTVVADFSATSIVDTAVTARVVCLFHDHSVLPVVVVCVRVFQQQLSGAHPLAEPTSP